MSPPAFASVVVCTRNRSRTLARCCAAALAGDFPADRWELLVVDNGSTDDTLQVAAELERAHPRLVRVVEEPEVGLSAARNAGIRAARGDVIVFLDDDAFPERGWLRAHVTAFADENVSVAGGPVEPLFDGQPPPWLDHRFRPYLGAWDRGSEIHALTYNEYPRGGNMAFHRRVFEELGGFSRHLGLRGSLLLACEEVELCLRVERGGGRILYVPAARVHHLTKTEQITARRMRQRFFAQGASEAILEWRHGGFRGLRRGWRRWQQFYRHARGDRQPVGDAPSMRRCLGSALAGHTRSCLLAPLTVPRYRPPAGVAVAAWPPAAHGAESADAG